METGKMRKIAYILLIIGILYSCGLFIVKEWRRPDLEAKLKKNTRDKCPICGKPVSEHSKEGLRDGQIVNLVDTIYNGVVKHCNDDRFRCANIRLWRDVEEYGMVYNCLHCSQAYNYNALVYVCDYQMNK